MLEKFFEKDGVWLGFKDRWYLIVGGVKGRYFFE